jgi:hypothetical protein
LSSAVNIVIPKIAIEFWDRNVKSRLLLKHGRHLPTQKRVACRLPVMFLTEQGKRPEFLPPGS